MPIELKMPALSPTMEKGTLARWLVKPGDRIRAGDLIAEIETDKATMEMEADEDGRISQLLVEGGTEDVAVGRVIAMLSQGDDGEAEAHSPAKVAPAPVAIMPVSAPVQTAPAQTAKASSAPQVAIDAGILASPLAKRIATARGIALAGIAGSGPRGKVLKADLGISTRIAAEMPRAPAASAPLAIQPQIMPPPEGVPFETIKLSTMRKTIARRLTESKQQVPHFYLTARCCIDPLLELRARLNTELASTGIKLSVNDMLVKALALALRAVPDANVQFGGDVLHRFGRADIAMAVAIDGGLVTPVIHNADALSLSAIATRSRGLAEKARSGKLQPHEYQGGTASLSNLGMFGIDEMFPVINPPQALIMGIGAGIEQPWRVDGGIALATVVAATASFDHRAIDGAVAAQFMAAFRKFVEAPMLLVC